MMTEQAKEARRAYKREWAKANPEKVRAQQARYWERKAREKTEPVLVGRPQVGA